MRVYLPSTIPAVRAVLDSRTVPASTGYAVTPALREWYAESGADEMEYAALLAAARASLRLLDVDPTAARRRVVLAVDVPDADVRIDDQADRGAVQVGGPVPIAELAAVHVDAPEAEADIAAAADAVIEADLGGTDAEFTVDSAEGHELLWYATQELDALLGELSS